MECGRPGPPVTGTQRGGRCRLGPTPALEGAEGVGLGRFTPRERELASRAATGRTNAEIADELGISVRTVNNLLQRAYIKLGVSGRRELPALLRQL